MRRRIYIETTIPSFYHETREEPRMVARREWTRLWWAKAVKEQEVVASEAVYDELSRGKHETREACLELLKGLPLLAILPPVAEIVEGYFAHQLMPRDPAGDALHLALASYHRCDFLVTWNCRHLANANKFDHIRRVNGILGVHVPSLVTPLELLED